MSTDHIADLRERLARVEENQKHQSTSMRDGFQNIGEKLDSIDDRLRGVEVKSGTIGAIAGTIMSVGTSLVMAKLTGKA